MAGPSAGTIRLTVEVEREDDGRWIAEIPELPGVIVYGTDQQTAIDSAKGLALNVIGERIRRGEDPLTGLQREVPARTANSFKRIEFEAALAV
jgi:predicted RNase H-like HicB family nuclease